MANRCNKPPSVREDVENLWKIITRLSVKSLADAGSDVCEIYFFAVADVGEQRNELFNELEFRESTGMDGNEKNIYSITNPDDISADELSERHEKPKLFVVRDHNNEGV